MEIHDQKPYLLSGCGLWVQCMEPFQNPQVFFPVTRTSEALVPDPNAVLLIFRVRVLTGVIDFSPENIVRVEAGFKARLVDDPDQIADNVPVWNR